MTGYVNIYQAELKVKSLAKYKAYYCGLCRALSLRFSEAARLAVSYDFTFLLMLHGSLYGGELKREKYRCMAHPLSKETALLNPYTEYSADMNMYMLYKKLQDDRLDDSSVSRIAAIGKNALEKLMRGISERLQAKYPEKLFIVDRRQEELVRLELDGVRDMELLSSCFGHMLGEIFVFKQDEWEGHLYHLGYYMGKFIYIMDAFEDRESDYKYGRFNPMLNDSGESIYSDEEVKEMLTINMAAAVVEFEQLPCVRDYDILSNILFCGIWQKYYQITNKNKRNKNV